MFGGGRGSERVFFSFWFRCGEFMSMGREVEFVGKVIY